MSTQLKADTGGAKVAVVTHARLESYFLELWVNYYGDLFGHENLHLLKDGEDWSHEIERHIGNVSLVSFSGSRQERDQQIALTLSAYCSGLLESYDVVLRVDCDEFLAPDPDHGSWLSIFEECKKHGYIYSFGLDIAHHTGVEGPFEQTSPILNQRRHARVTGEYCKPNIISAPVTWTSACHEIEGKPVHLSEALLLFHLASFDQDLLISRQLKRGDLSGSSYAGHEAKKVRQLERLKEFTIHDYDDARAELQKKITIGEDGHKKLSPRFRKVFGRRWAAIRLPDRFCNLINLKASKDIDFPKPKAGSKIEMDNFRKAKDAGEKKHQAALFKTPRVHVVRTEIHGERIFFCVENPKDAIQKCHFAGNFYEEEELDLIRQHFPIGGTLCDIGCNIGNHALYAAKFLHARKVLLFEPNPASINLLRCNIALNEIGAVCDETFIGIGLSDGQQASGSLVPDKANNLGGTSIREGNGDIRLAKGDDLLADQKFDLIKIDVEGLEMKVLAGMSQYLKTSKTKLFIEVDRENETFFQAWRKENGYHVLSHFKRYRQNTNYLLGR